MRAAITGWAWRTPLGDDVGRAVSRLLAGERAATERLRFPADTYAVKVGAPILSEPRPSRHRRFLRRMGLFAVEVAQEALAHATVEGGDRLGLFAGYGGLRAHWNDMMPALARQEPSGDGAWERGLSRLHPYWMLQHLSNNAHALLAADVQARGDGMTLGGANAGAQALAAALRALEAGAIDAALVVAYDSLLEPETLVELGARGAAHAGALETLQAPYSAGAHGFVPGEAAAALVLEPVANAKRWTLATVDALDSAGASAAELAARLDRAAVVDGAGIAHPEADRAERESLARLLSPEAPLLCTTAAMGQLGAATALVQAIAVAEQLRRGTLAPVAGLASPADGPLRPLTRLEQTRERAALALSAGAPGLAGAVRLEIP